MSKRGKALGLVAVGVGLAVAVGFLHGQTLDRAAAWATVAGFFVSTVLSLAGIVLGWLAWRDGHRDVVPATGSIRQRNRDGYNLASTGRYEQRHQDRREKRQRIHASLRRVLLEAGALMGMTRPMGGAAWSEDRMSEEERRAFHAALTHSADELRNAAVDLTLEGIEEPVVAVTELVRRFDNFRWHHRQSGRPGVTEELARGPAEASQAIAAIRADLEARLPAILDDILPVGRRRRWLAGLRRRIGWGRGSA